MFNVLLGMLRNTGGSVIEGVLAHASDTLVDTLKGGIIKMASAGLDRVKALCVNVILKPFGKLKHLIPRTHNPYGGGCHATSATADTPGTVCGEAASGETHVETASDAESTSDDIQPETAYNRDCIKEGSSDWNKKRVEDLTVKEEQTPEGNSIRYIHYKRVTYWRED